ncbi:AAA family ATPase [Candidatus Babeliales bacterium]|nr:AAA family ATPase [Candidatus Babeliales bacterium]MBP9843684.1 AAA family ATPase [Candidatus Babeliales bacterium]
MRLKFKKVALLFCLSLFSFQQIDAWGIWLGNLWVDDEDAQGLGHYVFNNPSYAYYTGAAVFAGIFCTGGYMLKKYWITPASDYLNKLAQGKDGKKDEMGKDNGMSDFTKSKARIYKPGDIKTKLSDVAGLEAAKLDVLDIMNFLKNPKAFIEMGAKIPKGVLFEGPPGNGKTLLAKAIAGEVECPFISVCASEFIEMFVGAGAARIRDLFAKAKELAPCILFIDEFDAIGRKRSSVSFGGGDEQSQTLAQLLTLMDGFDMQKYPIIIFAATNRAEVLDPAVIRPGRFDRIVEVGKPFLKDRIDILKVHLKNVKTSDQIDVPLIARATMGFSGAELANLVNEAAILAVNDKASCVTMKYIDQAYDNITLGRETKGMDVIDLDMWETAIHEAGHSIVRVFSQYAEPLYKVTITPRGGTLGTSYWLPLREKYSSKEVEMKAHIVVCLAGGLAEQEFGFGKMVGLSGDLKRARDIAYNMVTRYGMSEELRYMSYSEIDHNLPNDVATKIHAEVQKIIDECYAVSEQMVKEHRVEIEKLATMLMDEGTVFGNAVYKMCGVEEPRIDYGLSKQS